MSGGPLSIVNSAKLYQ